MRSPRPSPRRLALLGATGSIGRQVCDLVERHPDRFTLHALIAGSDAAALQEVARRHPEAHALLAHPADARGGEAARAIADAPAPMMNQGLGVIEAHFPFDVPYSGIDVIVPPQSVVHSMVEFVDGSIKAQLGVPDMHLPIAIALSYPDRLEGVAPPPDLAALGQLSLAALQPGRYPAAVLAPGPGGRGGSRAAVC